MLNDPKIKPRLLLEMETRKILASFAVDTIIDDVEYEQLQVLHKRNLRCS